MDKSRYVAKIKSSFPLFFFASQKPFGMVATCALLLYLALITGDKGQIWQKKHSLLMQILNVVHVENICGRNCLFEDP